MPEDIVLNLHFHLKNNNKINYHRDVALNEAVAYIPTSEIVLKHFCIVIYAIFDLKIEVNIALTQLRIYT